MYKLNPFVLGMVLLFPQFLFSEDSNAAIFKCVGEQGKVFYNDKPCPKNNSETEIQAIKDPINGYIPEDTLQPELLLDANKKGLIVGGSKNDDNNEKEQALIDDDDIQLKDNDGQGIEGGSTESSASANDLASSDVDRSDSSSDSTSAVEKEKLELVRQFEKDGLNVITVEPLDTPQ